MDKFIIPMVLLFVLSACNVGENLPEEMPDDFAFSLKYGITAANELNTYDDTYTKDLVVDGTATTEMVLSREELKYIYDKFKHASVLDLPDEKPTSPCMEPYNAYELLMTANGVEYHLVWDASCESEALIHWENAMNDIHREIIDPKPEYKALPEPTGGYD